MYNLLCVWCIFLCVVYVSCPMCGVCVFNVLCRWDMSGGSRYLSEGGMFQSGEAGSCQEGQIPVRRGQIPARRGQVLFRWGQVSVRRGRCVCVVSVCLCSVCGVPLVCVYNVICVVYVCLCVQCDVCV